MDDRSLSRLVPRSDASAIKVATYNIHKAVGRDGRRDPERIVAVLRELDADIIALQEADRRFGERAGVLGPKLLAGTPWKPASVARRPLSIGWHGNAMLVRRTISIEAAEAITLPTLEPRGAVYVRLSSSGKTLAIYGTHLDLCGLRRRAQIAAILRHHNSNGAGLAIVLGDFNDWGRRAKIAKPFGPEWQVLAPGPSFPSSFPIGCLDKIAISGGLTETSQGVHRSNLASIASDHLPVWANITLPVN